MVASVKNVLCMLFTVNVLFISTANIFIDGSSLDWSIVAIEVTGRCKERQAAVQLKCIKSAGFRAVKQLDQSHYEAIVTVICTV